MDFSNLTQEEIDAQIRKDNEAIDAQGRANPGLGGATAVQEVDLDKKADAVGFVELTGRAVELSTPENLYNVAKRANLLPWNPMPVDPDFNINDHLDMLKREINPDDWHKFQGVQSWAEYRDLKEDIDREMEDRSILSRNMNGGVASLAAAAVDPLNYLPFIGEGKLAA